MGERALPTISITTLPLPVSPTAMLPCSPSLRFDSRVMNCQSWVYSRLTAEGGEIWAAAAVGFTNCCWVQKDRSVWQRAKKNCVFSFYTTSVALQTDVVCWPPGSQDALGLFFFFCSSFMVSPTPEVLCLRKQALLDTDFVVRDGGWNCCHSYQTFSL